MALAELLHKSDNGGSTRARSGSDAVEGGGKRRGHSRINIIQLHSAEHLGIRRPLRRIISLIEIEDSSHRGNAHGLDISRDAGDLYPDEVLENETVGGQVHEIVGGVADEPNRRRELAGIRQESE